MLGAAPELVQTFGAVDVDAQLGRQVSAAVDLLRARRDAGGLGDIVVVHVGNNGTFTAGQFDELTEVLSGVEQVVLVNVKVPRDWEHSNNDVLAEGVRQCPNCALVDWYAASAGRPDLFWDDRMHLRPAGAQLYASLIAASMEG